MSYILSFVYMGIYWNHHHMLHTMHRVTGSILWANLHLLFWLSLFPFTTGWVGHNHATAIPAAFYKPWIAGSIFVFVALMWLAPDRRIEHALGENRD